MMEPSPLYLSKESIKFYSLGACRAVIKMLKVNLEIIVVDDRIDKELGTGIVQDILHDTLSDEGNHVIIIELRDGRIIKTVWSNVYPEIHDSD